jgi:hypothetical protein
VIEDVTPDRKLSAAEDAGLLQALRSVETGRTITAATAHARLRGVIKEKSGKPTRRPAAHR